MQQKLYSQCKSHTITRYPFLETFRIQFNVISDLGYEKGGERTHRAFCLILPSNLSINPTSKFIQRNFRTCYCIFSHQTACAPETSQVEQIPSHWSGESGGRKKVTGRIHRRHSSPAGPQKVRQMLWAAMYFKGK